MSAGRRSPPQSESSRLQCRVRRYETPRDAEVHGPQGAGRRPARSDCRVHRLDVLLLGVGPEGPLVDGVVDVFESRGLTIFGPTAQAAQLEGSKIFMKNFLARHSVPTAKYIETDSLQDAYKFIETLEVPIVVKADGLCGGKGVIIAQSHDEAKKAAGEMLSGNSFGDDSELFSKNRKR